MGGQFLTNKFYTDHQCPAGIVRPHFHITKWTVPNQKLGLIQPIFFRTNLASPLGCKSQMANSTDLKITMIGRGVSCTLVCLYPSIWLIDREGIHGSGDGDDAVVCCLHLSLFWTWTWGRLSLKQLMLLSMAWMYHDTNNSILWRFPFAEFLFALEHSCGRYLWIFNDGTMLLSKGPHYLLCCPDSFIYIFRFANIYMSLDSQPIGSYKMTIQRFSLVGWSFDSKRRLFTVFLPMASLTLLNYGKEIRFWGNSEVKGGSIIRRFSKSSTGSHCLNTMRIVFFFLVCAQLQCLISFCSFQ